MRRALALGFASCGSAIAAFLMLRVASTLPGPAYWPAATIWPFPGLYLVEVVALAFIPFLAVLAGGSRAFFAAWMAIGALSALTLLGAMTIGPVIGVSLLALAPASLLGEQESAKHLWRHAAAFVLGLGIQAVGMFVMIQAMLLR